MITGVPEIGCQHISDASRNSRDMNGWELVLQCLDSQHKAQAEDIRVLKSALIQLNETYDNLKREIEDDKLSLRHELHEFRGDFRLFCSQQVSCPACCNHQVKKEDITYFWPKPLYDSSVTDSSMRSSSEVPATSSAMPNSHYAQRDFLFQVTPKKMIFNSDIFMVISSPTYL